MRERVNHAFAHAGIRQPGTLTDVGGRPDGYHPLRHEGPEAPLTSERPRGAVPPDTRPREEPPVGAEPAAEEPERAVRLRDETTELRIMRGPQPRPD
jgi:hypothetical protein